MALVFCLECSREVSDAAVACPGCGAPMSSRPTRVIEQPGLLGRSGTAWGAANFGCLMLILGGVGLAIIVMLSSGCSGGHGDGSGSPAGTAEREPNDLRVNATLLGSGPGEFRFYGETVGVGQDDVFRVETSATGTVTARVTFSADGPALQVVELWQNGNGNGEIGQSNGVGDGVAVVTGDLTVPAGEPLTELFVAIQNFADGSGATYEGVVTVP